MEAPQIEWNAERVLSTLHSCLSVQAQPHSQAPTQPPRAAGLRTALGLALFLSYPSLQTDTAHIVPVTLDWQEVSPSLAAHPRCAAKTWGCHHEATCLLTRTLVGWATGRSSYPMRAGLRLARHCATSGHSPLALVSSSINRVYMGQWPNCFCLHERKF